MGNLQERIRQAQEREIRAKAQYKVYEDERRLRQSIESAERNARKKKDDIAETNLLKEEFFPLMERLGAIKLLQEVKEDVWRVGEIDTEPQVRHHDTGGNRIDDSCRLGLHFEYGIAYEQFHTRTIGDGARDMQRTDVSSLGWKRGTAQTAIAIIIKRSFTIPLEEGKRVEDQAGRLRHRQSFQGRPYGYNWEFSLNESVVFTRDFDPLNPEKSRIKLEDLF